MAVEQLIDGWGGRLLGFEFHLLYFFDSFVIKTVYADRRLGVYVIRYRYGDERGTI